MTHFASTPVGGSTAGRRLLVSLLGAALLVTGGVVPVSADAPARYSDWGEGAPVDAVNLPPPSHDGCPIESPNGKQLFIASNRAGTLGMNDIWVTARSNKHEPWGAVQHLDAPVNSAYNDFCPTPVGGGWLLFVSTRPAENCAGASPNGDIYLTRQHPDGSWRDPIHLACYPNGPNFVGAEFGPSLVTAGGRTLLYYSSNGANPGTDPDQDIYVSGLGQDGRFGPGVPVAELNTSAEETMPNVSGDHTEMVFASNRVGGEGATDIYSATWDHQARTWSDVTNLANVNTAAPESRPSLSGDGLRLYFGRFAAPGDVYVSTRVELGN
jgi:hypothetical protein